MAAEQAEALAPLELDEADVKSCCAALYEHPAVRWLLGGELHPGGEALSRRALDLLELGAGERLLDVAGGCGTTALIAAREHVAIVTGIDYGAEAVAEAGATAASEGLAERASFVQGDAERLPFGDAEFDSVICECALCTFADKRGALTEMRRVLGPGGRLALSDVYADPDLVADGLRGVLATVACVGDALPRGEHERLLEEAGFEPVEVSDEAEAADGMAERVLDRLRGARLAGADGLLPIEGGLGAAIEIVREARTAIAEGRLGYRLIIARVA